MRPSHVGRTLLFVILAAVFAFSLSKLIEIESTYRREKMHYLEIASAINNDVQEPEEKNEDGILKQYEKLYESNRDFIGWIRIEDTNINYPVMYTPDDPDYYLRKNFNKEYAISGTPFVGEGCDVNDSDAFVIYGHMMKNHTMFAQLKDYESKSFWQAHPLISFDTLEAHRVYQVFAALNTEIPADGQKGFRYYELVGALNKQAREELLEGLRERQHYDTGLTPPEGAQIMLLSTCSYHARDGRCVVAAFRIG